MASEKKAKPARRSFRVLKDDREFTLDVSITDGPMTEEFADKNPEISRKIELRGDDTLDELHLIIFKAFNRFDPHMYEFQVGGKGPMDPEARRYVLPLMLEGLSKEDMARDGIAGNLQHVTIGSLNLKPGDAFGYWFDFGDDWWHQIDVVSIQPEASPKKKYPRIVSRIGKSPPQYARWEEYYEEDEE